MSRYRRLPPSMAFLLFLAASGAAAGESGFERAISVDRERLARNITLHDFENVRDPDTGAILPESADMNADGWPDFWEPVRAVGFPEYLVAEIGIVPDAADGMPGRYRDVGNNALHFAYDGTRVGIRTRAPTLVDPAQAYEFSLSTRDAGLEGAAVRAGVEWLRIDAAAVASLRLDTVPDIPTGQADWPVVPWRMRIDDPPPTANAARLFVTIERVPGVVGGGYHGDLWVDDIAFERRPRIAVAVAKPGEEAEGVPIAYSGLFDNVPDPENPGFFKGKRYFRRITITDVFNRPLIGADLGKMTPLTPNDENLAVERIPFPRDKFGVYYFGVRLYDAERRLVTDAFRAMAVMKPAAAAGGGAILPGRPVFGVRAGMPPPAILAVPGRLRDIVSRAGARLAKVVPWPDAYDNPGGNEANYAALAEELRVMRAGGLGLVGVMRPPAAMFGGNGLAPVIGERADRFSAILDEAGRRIGLFLDEWQWGDDMDGGLAGLAKSPELDAVAASLAAFAGGLPTVWNATLGAANAAFPLRPTIVNAYFPPSLASDSLWPETARRFPWLFEPFRQERGRIYPPPELSRLAPPPSGDAIEERQRRATMTGTWLSLEPEAVNPHEIDASSERTQLEQFLIRAVYAAALSPDAVFLGDVFDPGRGLLRRHAGGDPVLETLARPAYLAAGVVSEMLEGAEYLGRLGLLAPFEAHVFRRAGSDSAIIAIWQHSPAAEAALPRAEIADGVQLQLVDWAGNASPLPRSIPVRRVPSFITGMPAGLILTRMSVRIAPEPPVMAVSRRQNQQIEVVNHTARQTPVMFRLRYAARPGDGTMEGGWTTTPEELRVNLPAGGEGRAKYVATPDPNSPVQNASPLRVDKSGEKIARVMMGVAASPPAEMTLYLPFNLRSDLDVDIVRLERTDDPNFVTLQLRARWLPPGGAAARRAAIKVTPFYQKRGQMKDRSAFPVAINPTPEAERNRPDSMFEAIELRIPRLPVTRTMVGLEESGGGTFYLADVTDFLQ